MEKPATTLPLQQPRRGDNTGDVPVERVLQVRDATGPVSLDHQAHAMWPAAHPPARARSTPARPTPARRGSHRPHLRRTDARSLTERPYNPHSAAPEQRFSPTRFCSVARRTDAQPAASRPCAAPLSKNRSALCDLPGTPNAKHEPATACHEFGNSVTRFDRLAVRYQAILHAAAINEWL